MLAPGSVASSEGTAVYRISTFSERDYDGKIPHREDNGAGGTERCILVEGAVHTVICLHSGSELKESDRNFKTYLRKDSRADPTTATLLLYSFNRPTCRSTAA